MNYRKIFEKIIKKLFAKFGKNSIVLSVTNTNTGKNKMEISNELKTLTDDQISVVVAKIFEKLDLEDRDKSEIKENQAELFDILREGKASFNFIALDGTEIRIIAEEHIDALWLAHVDELIKVEIGLAIDDMDSHLTPYLIFDKEQYIRDLKYEGNAYLNAFGHSYDEDYFSIKNDDAETVGIYYFCG